MGGGGGRGGLGEGWVGGGVGWGRGGLGEGWVGGGVGGGVRGWEDTDNTTILS